MPGKVVTLVGYDIHRELYRVWDDTSEIGSLLADTPIPSTNAQDNDDADHTPLLVPTHENTNTPDSPTHDTKQPQHSESEQQNELSLEQSLQDDSYKNVSIGPTPNSDFTAPDADYTDPNHYVEGQVQGEPTRFHKRRLYPKFKILTVNRFQKDDIRRNRTSGNCGRCYGGSLKHWTRTTPP
eukprot:g12669.t1